MTKRTMKIENGKLGMDEKRVADIIPGTETNPYGEGNCDIRKKCLRPVLIAMTLCGCYSPRYNGGIRSKLFLAYRSFVFLSSLTFVVKGISAFFYISRDEYHTQILQLLWVMAGFTNFLVGLKTTSGKFGHLHLTMDKWSSQIIPNLNQLHVGYNAKLFKRKQLILMCFGATSMIIILGVHISHIPENSVLKMTEPDFATAPFKPSALTHAISLVLMIYQVMLGTIPVLYIITLSIILGMHFRAFSVYLDQQICESSCKIPDNFQELRTLHNSLCGMVQDLDKDVQYFYGGSFVWNMMTSLFSLYVILKTDNLDFFGLSIFVYFFVLGIGTLTVISIFAAFVNEAAHAPLDRIYYLNVSDVDLEKLAQINLFLSKLTGTQVGFSTCGLLIITKEFILTIAGVFLTYFAVLYTL